VSEPVPGSWYIRIARERTCGSCSVRGWEGVSRYQHHGIYSLRGTEPAVPGRVSAGTSTMEDKQLSFSFPELSPRCLARLDRVSFPGSQFKCKFAWSCLVTPFRQSADVSSLAGLQQGIAHAPQQPLDSAPYTISRDLPHNASVTNAHNKHCIDTILMH
jgi:hypothetical protein